jgi:hypothetical protein
LIEIADSFERSVSVACDQVQFVILTIVVAISDQVYFKLHMLGQMKTVLQNGMNTTCNKHIFLNTFFFPGECIFNSEMIIGGKSYMTKNIVIFSQIIQKG